MVNKRLGNREIVLGMKSMCANDRKVVKKDEKLPEGVPNGSNLENETNELSQTTSQHDNGQSRRTESIDIRDIVLGLKSNDYETKELSQTPSQHKKSRRKEITVASSPRILRSRSQEKPKVVESVDVPSQENKEKKRKKRKKTHKEHHNNEFTKIRTHIKYLLNRMKYEQNFIEAYVGEGWKGQSLEKLRPEKELERAKSDINRYKLKIRDLFKRIDTSCEEGRIPESLYDSEGEIDSEDIFCAKCGQTDVRLDNDILLCDGVCERGFHQYCLDPPLLKEQVPPGDEGWLCPACDCKVDCVDFLNDYLGTDLSIEDSWEKVFPETAVFGNKLDDNLGLPSDDSEDDDYNPDGPQVEEDGCNFDGPQVEEDEVDAGDSSSDESDFSSASEDLAEFAKNDDVLGLPSDDSEDDDFNPDRLESDEEAKKEGSSSDFSSDSEDLDDIKNEVALNEVHKKEKPIEGNTENDDFGPITVKRNVERLDYKRLHDEAYGNASSDSSDEDFSDSGDEDVFDSEARKRKNTKGAKNIKVIKKQKQSESTPVGKRLIVEDTSDSPAHNGFSDNNGNKSSSCKRYGGAVTQRLNEAFNENHYLDRGVRENLVKELNLTHSQVNKWFEKARWRLNHPEGRGKSVKSPLKPAEKLVAEQTNELLGLHSDDLEEDDGDFNPDKLDSDEEVKKEGSGSDFTSDSEDLDDIKNEVISDEVQEKEELIEGNLDNDDFGPITSKRKVQRLDYKKLHDEAHGNDSSDSSDEDFIDSEVLSAQKNTHGTKDTENNKKQKQCEITPVRKKLIVEGTSYINGSRPSSYKRLEEAAIMRLNEAFNENRYPDRNAREILVKELNLTHSQVSKWFGNARWKFNHTEGHSKLVKSPAEKVVRKQASEVISTTRKSRKRKTNADSSDQPTRRSGRVQAKSS